MKNQDNSQQSDIATQRYKGPNFFVTGLGEGIIHAKILATIGFFAGGVAAYIFHEPLGAKLGGAKHWMQEAVNSEKWLTKTAGIILKFPLDLGNHLAEAVIKLGPVKKGLARLNQTQKVEAAIDGAIVTSTAASILAGFTGMGDGAHTAIVAEKQLKTAQRTIIDLREQNKILAAQAPQSQVAEPADAPPPQPVTNPVSSAPSSPLAQVQAAHPSLQWEGTLTPPAKMQGAVI